MADVAAFQKMGPLGVHGLCSIRTTSLHAGASRTNDGHTIPKYLCIFQLLRWSPASCRLESTSEPILLHLPSSQPTFLVRVTGNAKQRPRVYEDVLRNRSRGASDLVVFHLCSDADTKHDRHGALHLNDQLQGPWYVDSIFRPPTSIFIL